MLIKRIMYISCYASAFLLLKYHWRSTSGNNILCFIFQKFLLCLDILQLPEKVHFVYPSDISGMLQQLLLLFKNKEKTEGRASMRVLEIQCGSLRVVIQTEKCGFKCRENVLRDPYIKKK